MRGAEKSESGDPVLATWLIALGFFCVGLIGLDNWPAPIFDEQHYIPAANHLLIGDIAANREHPPLAKELIALAIGLFGDNPFGWRIAPLAAGTFGLVAWSRAVWWHSHSRSASLLFSILLASNFLLFSLSRLAMLDVFMFAFTGGAVVAFLLGLERPSWLVACGIFLGLALACKWSAAPVALVLAIACLLINRSQPHRAILLLGVLPLLVYAITFVPLLTVQQAPLAIADFPALQLAMLRRVGLFVYDSPFSSQWWDWLLNWRPIVLAKEIEGSFHVALIGGNPLTMPAIVLAAVLALFAGRRFERARIPALMYIVTLAFWAASQKPVQYQFHYLLPSTFGVAVLAIVLADFRRCSVVVTTIALLAFAWCFPILIAAPLADRDELAAYEWLPGWALHRSVSATLTPTQREALQSAEACLRAPRRC